MHMKQNDAIYNITKRKERTMLTIIKVMNIVVLFDRKLTTLPDGAN